MILTQLDILDGNFDLDKLYTTKLQKLYYKELHIQKQTLQKMAQNKISLDEMKYAFSKLKENINSSPSSRHLHGQYPMSIELERRNS